MEHPPLKDRDLEVAVPLMKPRQPAAAGPRSEESSEGNRPDLHLISTSRPPQSETRNTNSNAPEVPFAELRLLAKAHGATTGASVDMRTTRTRVGLFTAALLGIGVILAWHHYGDTATAMLNTAIGSPAQLSSRSAANVVPIEQSDVTVVAPSTHDPAALPPQPLIGAAPNSTATSPELQQQLEAMAGDFAIMKRSLQQLEAMAGDIAIVKQNLQQLGAKQEELARRVATPQASNDAKQKLLSPPPARAALISPRKTPASVSPVQAAAQPLVQGVTQPSSNQTSLSDPRPATIPRPPSSIRDDYSGPLGDGDRQGSNSSSR
jgi:hypothetical protein